MSLFSELDPGLITTAFNHVDVGLLIHNEDGAIIELNEAIEKVTGFSRAEMVGRDFRSFFNRANCQESCAMCGAIKSRRGITGFEAQVIAKDGSLLCAKLDSFPFNSGGDLGFLVVFKDAAEIQRLKERTERSQSFHNIVGKSKAIKGAFEFVHRLGDTDVTVLILGSTGTGKELIASALHHHGSRRNGPFIAVNCAALPEHLLESELFGHVKGAFTGALKDRMGRFEAASGGTIFLDEIGEISNQAQLKLLRVLQEKEVERLGEHRSRKVDARVVAATNKDLANEVREGRFREDLYYRLIGCVVNMPLLKERKEDIPLLVSNFISKFSAKHGRDITGISSGLMSAMMTYHWPGNIRELYNLMESAVLMCKGRVIDTDCVPSGYFERKMPDRAEPCLGTRDSLEGPREASERDAILSALEAERYKVSGAAKSLGIHRTTLWRKMKTLGIDINAK